MFQLHKCKVYQLGLTENAEFAVPRFHNVLISKRHENIFMNLLNKHGSDNSNIGIFEHTFDYGVLIWPTIQAAKNV